MESTKYICHLELIPTSKLVYIKETYHFLMSRIYIVKFQFGFFQEITQTKVEIAVASLTRIPVVIPPIIRMRQWSPVITTAHQSIMVVKKIIVLLQLARPLKPPIL
jgi:hypothetical protein